MYLRVDIVKILVNVFFILSFVLMPVNAFAAGKPLVKMANEVYTYSMGVNNIRLDENTKARLWQSIHNKLLTMQEQGKLPFELVDEVAASTHKIGELVGDSDVYLIPAVMVNSARDTNYSSTTETYYNSAVVSGISLIFCITEENYEIGGVTYKMLGMVPLVNSCMIGSDQNNKRTTPISDYEKISKFVELSNASIENQLNFSSAMKNLKDENARFSMDTYQVTDVNISSQKAQQAFPGTAGEELKFLVAYNYTAGYQQKNKRIVYPPSITSNSFANDIAKNAYKLSLDGPNGSVDVGVSAPAHRISLDITGANYTYDNNVIAYKVWLAKSPVEKSEKAELERGYSRGLVNAGNINIDHSGVYSRLLMGLAWELGGQKL